MFSQRDGYNNMFVVLISKFDSWNLWRVLHRSHICGEGAEEQESQACNTSRVNFTYTRACKSKSRSIILKHECTVLITSIISVALRFCKQHLREPCD